MKHFFSSCEHIIVSTLCRELTKAFITFPKPVIAGVGGSAVGLGVALLCLCDVVYSSDKAAFHLPYARLSQTPEGCSSFTLPLALGLASVSGCQRGCSARGCSERMFCKSSVLFDVIVIVCMLAKEDYLVGGNC